MRLRTLPALLLVLMIVLPGHAGAARQGALAVEYLGLIERGISQAQQDLPAITASAEQAAKVLIAGGKFWAGGPQGKFYLEAEVRAGGFMTIHNVAGREVGAGDLVLYGAPGSLTEQDAAQIKAWRDGGAHVVAFASAGGDFDDAPHALIGGQRQAGLPITVAGEAKLVPSDTTLNAVNLWVWSAEFIAACTRAGKLPVIYKSYGLEGGRAWERQYNGQTFHEDISVEPVKPGVLGAAYLDRVKEIIAGLREQLPDIRRAADWLRGTPMEQVLLVHMGHMFPDHWEEERTVTRFNRRRWAYHDQRLDDAPGGDDLILWIGYQRAPRAVIQQARETGTRVVYSAVQSDDPAEPSDRVIYLNPGWPLTDAMLDVPGYEVPICPGSGVTNAILYWCILAESYAPLTTRYPLAA